MNSKDAAIYIDSARAAELFKIAALGADHTDYLLLGPHNNAKNEFDRAIRFAYDCLAKLNQDSNRN